jgi:hypothetical protein
MHGQAGSAEQLIGRNDPQPRPSIPSWPNKDMENTAGGTSAGLAYEVLVVSRQRQENWTRLCAVLEGGINWTPTRPQ